MKLYRGHQQADSTVWATDQAHIAEHYADYNRGQVHTVTVDRDRIAPTGWLTDHGFAGGWTDAYEIDDQLDAILDALRRDGWQAVGGINDQTPELRDHTSWIVVPEASR